MAAIRKMWQVLAPACVMALSSVALAGPQDDANAGLDAVKAGDYAHAVQLFTRAIASGKLSSDDREYAYVQRGTAYLDMGNRTAAALDFQRALKIKPGDADARDGLSQARASSSGASRGGRGGGNPAQLAQAGMNALRTGAPAQAVALFSQAIGTGRMAGDDLELAFLSRGQAYMKLGSFREAVQDLDEALQLKTDDSDAQQAMVEALSKMPPPAPAPGFDAGACKRNMRSQGAGGGLGGFISGTLGVPQSGGGKTFTSFVEYQGLDRVNALAGLYRAMAQNSPAPGANWQFDVISLHNGFLSAEVTPPGATDPQIKLEAHIEASGSVTRVTMQEQMGRALLIVDIKASMCRTLASLAR